MFVQATGGKVTNYMIHTLCLCMDSALQKEQHTVNIDLQTSTKFLYLPERSLTGQMKLSSNEEEQHDSMSKDDHPGLSKIKMKMVPNVMNPCDFNTCFIIYYALVMHTERNFMKKYLQLL